MRTLLLTSLMVALVASCHHEEKKDSLPTAVAQQTPATTPAADNQTNPNTSSGDKTCGSDAECGPRQLCIRNRCVDISPDMAECSNVRIHFDFDATQLHEDEKPLLDRMSRCLKGDHALHVTIEGNADERGTQEYNLALGDKRATEVERYLELLGVSKAQLKTVSYGKEHPLCAAHDEDCWAKNRRAALKSKEGKR